MPGGGGGMPPGQNPAYTSMPPQMGEYPQQGAFNMQGRQSLYINLTSVELPKMLKLIG